MTHEMIFDGVSPSELSADVAKVEANARHLVGLINDVLDISKVESSKMETFAEHLDVAETLKDVVATSEGLIARNGNTLVVSIAPKGGTVTLAANRIVRAGPDAWLAFRVSDTGIGMTEEHLGRLFQRFAQADSSTTRQFGGTGLGLALNKAFASMLGGDIAVESRLGESSTFTLMLPVSMPPIISEPDLANA